MNCKLALLLLLFSALISAYALAGSVAVNITESGFNPQQITIAPGTKVIFQNAGLSAHWPASNKHPTHRDYPGSGIEKCASEENGSILDACRALKPGEEYAFTLTQEGEWAMHDHLNPGLLFSVVVKKGKAGFLDKLKAFFARFQKNEMTPKEFRNITFSAQYKYIRQETASNPDKAWLFLKKTFLVNGESIGYAHEFAHVIGNQFYNTYGANGFSHCTDDFASGCQHGVAEKMLSSFNGDIAATEKACTSFGSNSQRFINDCFHGLGHGIIASAEYDIKKGLKACDNLTQQGYRSQCYAGVFMENNFNDPATNKQKATPAQALEFCSKIDDKYKGHCAEYAATALFDASESKEITGVTCGNITETTLKSACNYHMGMAVGARSNGKLDYIYNKCNSNIKGRESCLEAAARAIAWHRYVGWKTNSLAICKALNDSVNCMGVVEYYMQD